MSDDLEARCHEAVLASCTQLSGLAVTALKPGQFQWVRSDDAAAACARLAKLYAETVDGEWGMDRGPGSADYEEAIIEAVAALRRTE